MGVCNSPYIFQEERSELLERFGMAFAYIDNVLVITKDDLVNLRKQD